MAESVPDAAAQQPRGGPESVGSLDQSLIDRLRKRQLGAETPSERITSPVDQAISQRGAGSAVRARPSRMGTSRLEADYRERLRLGESGPTQFGYGQIASLNVSMQPGTGGAINGNYVLGIGDELVITFRGQVNNSYRTAVDREGQVILPDMPPVPAAGRSFRRFQSELSRRARVVYGKTDAFVSLGRVRNFPVMVLGQVGRPGVHRMTGIATVLDAVAAAGGVRKSGSLRRIRLVRGQRVIPIDLYDLLLTGRLSADIALREGDRVFVPSIGDTVAIVGDVKRPGIYELGRRSSAWSVSQAVTLAGGTLRPSGYRYLHISGQPQGGDDVREVTNPQGSMIRKGNILLVTKLGYAWMGAFDLDGHVAVAGPRSLSRDVTVASVVRAPGVLLGDPYVLFGAIETTDPDTQARYFKSADLAAILSGRADMPIHPGDRLIILSRSDIAFLSADRVQAVIEGRRPRSGSAVGADAASSGKRSDRSRCLGLRALATVVSRGRTNRFGSARLQQNPDKSAAIPARDVCPAIFDRYPKLLPFVLDHAVSVNGEVRLPGVYPVARGTALGTLIPVAGGLTRDADLDQIEVTRFDSTDRDGRSQDPGSTRRTISARSGSLMTVGIQPGDSIQFGVRFSDRDVGSVFLSGEFKRPGTYSIRRGEKMSQVIARAGGLTDQAYALGSVFSRVRVRKQEAKAFERAARDLESGLAESLASSSASTQGTDPATLVATVRSLANRLRTTTPVGRVVVEANPTVLQVRPEFDTVLEAGDRLHVPKRPNHVTVSGEVLNPGAIQFRAGFTVDQYIDAAGSVTRTADDSRVFVVLPNGEAKPVSVSSWNFTSVRIPPGSTIIMPRDPKPFDLLTFTVSVADILSKLAITAAALAVIAG